MIAADFYNLAIKIILIEALPHFSCVILVCCFSLILSLLYCLSFSATGAARFGIKPPAVASKFTCHVCQRSLAFLRGLQRHYKNKHPGVKFPAEFKKMKGMTFLSVFLFTVLIAWE